MSGPVLIAGATSMIARATAAAFAGQGRPLYLAGRDEAELRRIAADLAIRYRVPVRHGVLDVEDRAGHEAWLAEAIDTLGGLDGIVFAIGYLGDQQRAARDVDEAGKVIERNFTGAVSLLTHAAAYLEGQGRGFIIGISSVAGDRGRQSNYVYGAAKGALSLYLQGLRNRLAARGVRVITIKPGFVDTAMTYGMPGLFLVAAPASVGRRIAAAADRGGDVLYVPWFWRYIMLIIRLIPERIFKRLKL